MKHHERSNSYLVAVALFFLFCMMIAALALASRSEANPYLVCDPPTAGDDPAWYELDGLPWLTGQYPAEADLSMRVDLCDTPTGQPWTVKARACNVWGCSEWSSPLDFMRPISGPSTPMGLRIVE